MPAVLTAMAMYIVPRRVRHPLVVPVILLMSATSFAVIAYLSPHTAPELRQAGWLFSAPEGSATDWWKLPQGLEGVRLSDLMVAAPGLFLVSFVELISVLLQISAMERVTGRAVDLDAELRAQSMVNVAGGVCGSVPQVPFIGDTLLNLAIAGPNRQASWVLAVGCTIGAGVGLQLMPWIPVFVLAAVLMYFGVSLLGSTLIAGARGTDRVDYAIAASVAVVVSLFGFMTGLMCGVLIASLVKFARLRQSSDRVRVSTVAAGRPVLA